MWKNLNLSNNSFVSQLGNLAKDVFNDSAFSDPGAKLRNSDDEASYEEEEAELPVNTNSSFNLQKQLDYDDDITSDKIESLEAEIETLREKLSTEIKKNKATSKQYRDSLEITQREKLEVSKDYEALREQYERLQDTITELSEQQSYQSQINNDFSLDSTINQQFEVKKLKTLLQATQEENQRLKENSKTSFTGEFDDISQCRERINELELKLRETEESLQQQLISSIQHVSNDNQEAFESDTNGKNSPENLLIQRLNDKIEYLENKAKENEKMYEKLVLDAKKQLETTREENNKIIENMIKQHDDESLDFLNQQDEFKLQLEKAEKKTESLKKSLQLKDNQIDQLADGNSLLNNKLQAATNNYQELNTKFLQLEVDHKQILDNYKNTEEKLQNLKHKLNQTVENSKELQKFNGQLIQEKENIENSLNLLQNQFDYLQKDTGNHQKIIESLQSMNKQLIQKQESQIQQKEELENKLQTLEQTINQLKVENEKTTSELKIANQQLHKESAILHKKLLQRDNHIETLEKEIKEKATAVSLSTIPNIDNREISLLAQSEAHGKPFPTLAAPQSSEISHISAVDDLLQVERQKVQQLTEENVSLSNQLTTLIDEKNNLLALENQNQTNNKKEEENFSGKVQELSRQYEKLQEEFSLTKNKLNNEINEKTIIIEDLQNRNGQLDNLIKNHKKLIEDTKISYENSLKKLQENLDSLQKEQETEVESLNKRNQEKLKEKEAEIRQHTTEKDSLQVKLKEIEKQRDNVQRRNEELTMQINTTKESLNLISQEELKKKTENQQKEQNLIILTQLNDKLKHQIQEKTQEIEKLDIQYKQQIHLTEKLKEELKALNEKTNSTSSNFEKTIQNLRSELESQHKLTSNLPSADELENLMSKLNKANSQNDTLQNYLLEKDNELIKLQEQIDVHIKEVEIQTEKANKLYTETEELKQKLKENEEMKIELENKRKECLEKTTALENLQNLLEDSQAQYDTRLKSQLTVLQSKLTSTRSELDSALLKIQELERVQQQYLSSQQQLSLLENELNQTRNDLLHSQNEVEPIKKALNDTVARLSSFTSSELDFVDKRIMTQLIITYFTSPKEKKTDVLQVMARILNWSEVEQQKVGLLQNRGRWLGSLFASSTTAPTPTDNGNLANMWVEFLLKESEKL